MNNDKINDYLIKQSDDLKQEFYLQIMEYMLVEKKYNLIVDLYRKDELGKYCMGIIRNSLKNNSPYTLMYAHPKITLTNEFTEILDDSKEEIEKQKRKDILDRDTVDKIIHTLNNLDPYNSVLYKLRIGICPITGDIVKPKTYREIQELVGLSYVSVRNSCMRTEKIIKNL